VIDLAASAAQALVSSMTTAAWNEARAKLSAIFAKHKGHKRFQAELDASQARLKADPSLRDSETKYWAALLAAMAQASPDAAVDLAAIVSELAQLPGRSRAARVHQAGIALTGNQYNVAGNLIQRS
jgi:hypothetical protein